MKRIVSFFLITLALTIQYPLGALAQQQGGGGHIPPELHEKAVQLHTLMKEKTDAGVDVSKALELDNQSRDAAKSGDYEKAKGLIDQAISLLKASKGVKTTGTADAAKSGKATDGKTGYTEPAQSPATPVSEAKKPVPADLCDKAAQLHTLMKSRSDAGVDVSKAMELDRQSRDAAKAGDYVKAKSLIDQAITLVQGTKASGTAAPVK